MGTRVQINWNASKKITLLQDAVTELVFLQRKAGNLLMYTKEHDYHRLLQSWEVVSDFNFSQIGRIHKDS